MQNLIYIESIDKIILSYYEELILDKMIDFDIIDKIISDNWKNGNFIEVLEDRYNHRVEIINKKYTDVAISEKDHSVCIDKILFWLCNNINDQNKKLLDEMKNSSNYDKNKCIYCKNSYKGNYCNLI